MVILIFFFTFVSGQEGPSEEDCNDGIDNNLDGYIDLEDQDCPFTYTLTKGWNLIGCVFPTQDITTALSSIDGCYEGVYSFWAGLWRSFIPFKLLELNTLTNITFGRGYWIKVNCSSVKLFEKSPGELKYTKIAFVSNKDELLSEIYVMKADGSNQTRLTFNERKDEEPSWSPDGKKIAFASSRDGLFEIYVMNADGSNQTTRLTFNEYYDMWPAWSPNGNKIAFDSNRDGNFEIYVMNADGSNQTRLTFDDGNDIEPSWGPDGSKIAFASYKNGNKEIYVMNADGSNWTKITNDPHPDEEPSWSPDGNKIAFSCGGPLCIINPDGSNQTLLYMASIESGPIGRPTWSPNGKKIAFRIGHEGGIPEVYRIQNIYTINADGSNLIKLTNENDNPQLNKISGEPSWSPFLYSTN